MSGANVSYVNVNFAACVLYMRVNSEIRSGITRVLFLISFYFIQILMLRHMYCFALHHGRGKQQPDCVS